MTRAKGRDADRLADMLEAVERIQGWSGRGSDDMYRAAVLHELMIIGEAASALSEGFRGAHPEVPWRQIIGQRVMLAHHCWRADWPQVERTIKVDLPSLSKALQQIMKGERRPER